MLRSAPVEQSQTPPPAPGHPPTSGDGLAEAARRDFQFIWRVLRRMGVRPDSAVDDAVQQVFVVAARRRSEIEPGRERAFLFKTAVFVASDARRAFARRRDRESPELLEALDGAPDPEQRAQTSQERALLDHVLDQMSLETREVFVLFELEGQSSAEIAALVGIPVGTVASRLRRARGEFQAAARRLRATLASGRLP